VTLNPFKHLDLIGSAMILLVGFGWARPVPIYLPNFRYYRLGLFLVSIAGIVANLLIATALALVLRWMLASGYLGNPSGFVLVLAQAAAIAASINLTLAVFNLLPVPPLDGSKIVQSFLPLRWHPYIWRLEANPTYAIVAILLLLTVLRQPLSNFLGLVRTRFFDGFGL
jgi:Zn-dependent protease